MQWDISIIYEQKHLEYAQLFELLEIKSSYLFLLESQLPTEQNEIVSDPYFIK